MFAHRPDHLTADVTGLWAGQPRHNRRTQCRFFGVERVLGAFVGLDRSLRAGHGRRHPGAPTRADRIHGGADGRQLKAQGLGQTDDCGLRRAVVGLPEVAVQSGAGRGVDDAAVDLSTGVLGFRAPLAGDRAAGEPATADVYSHHQVEVVGGHIPDRFVANDARVVDDDVQPAQLRVGTLDGEVDLLLVAYIAEVGNCGAPTAFDDPPLFVGHLAGALAGQASAEVVDDHGGAVLGEFECVAAPDAVPGP